MILAGHLLCSGPSRPICRSAASEPDQQPAQQQRAGGGEIRPAQVKNLGREPLLADRGHHRRAADRLPVSWVYMGIRTAEEYDQSLISTILILPWSSLDRHRRSEQPGAGFRAGGIAGAVRFKNSLKSSSDALYILLSVAIGLASGSARSSWPSSWAWRSTIHSAAVGHRIWRARGMKRYMSDFGRDRGSPAPPPAARSAPPRRRPNRRRSSGSCPLSWWRCP